MAFLRLSNSKRSQLKSAKRKRGIEAEAKAWMKDRKAAQRPNVPVEMLGKILTTKRNAAEFAYRLATGDWSDDRPIEPQTVVVRINGQTVKQTYRGPSSAHVSGSYKARGSASMAVNKPSQGAASDGYMVREVNGIWRRYVGQPENWRWISDHATQADALEGRNPLA